MTVYIFDSSSFRVLNHYFPDRFPTFWKKFDQATTSGLIESVREVQKELSKQSLRPHVKNWVKTNKSIFSTPSQQETQFVSTIFAVPHFQYLVTQRQILRGAHVADPFIVAAAKIRGGVVVTEEDHKPNAARIPNVCEHFDIPWTNMEGFMEGEDWSF